MILAFATPHVGGVEFILIAIHTLAVLSHSFDGFESIQWAARQTEVVE